MDWLKRDNTTIHYPKNIQYVQRMYPSIKLHNIYLVDDMEYFVAKGQWDQWIPVLSYQGASVRNDDTELLRIKYILRDLIVGKAIDIKSGYEGDFMCNCGVKF